MINKLSLIAAMVICNLTPVQAELVLQPPGLGNGDLYRLVFVTSGFRNATSPDIEDYNTFVQEAVEVSPLAALGQAWTAIGSTVSVAARDNTHTNSMQDGPGVPIYLVDGSLVATGNTDLWDGTILHAINVDENGHAVGSFNSPIVWTGTDAGGTIAQLAWLGGDFPSDFAQRGRADRIDSEWIRYFAETNVQLNRVYGMSGVILAVPEPTCAACVSMALFLLLIGRRTHFRWEHSCRP